MRAFFTGIAATILCKAGIHGKWLLVGRQTLKTTHLDGSKTRTATEHYRCDHCGQIKAVMETQR